VRRTIEDADVVVVWSEVLPIKAWMAYEIGIASALQRPIVVWSSAEPARPPLAFLAASVVDPTDVVAAAKLLDSALGGNKQSAEPHPRRRLGKSNVSVQRVEDAISSGQGAVIALIHETLAKTGARPVQRAPGSPKLNAQLAKVDLAVWVDEFEGNFGNPVIIEVKDRLSSGSIPVTVRQINRYLSVTGASVGLIVYLQDSGDLESLELFRYAGRRVQWISVRTLFEDWRFESFSDLITKRILPKR
jgi:hypothetical protein